MPKGHQRSNKEMKKPKQPVKPAQPPNSLVPPARPLVLPKKG